MKDSRTLVTKRASCSKDKGLQLFAPQSWREMTQEQLRYLFRLMAETSMDRISLKAHLFVRFTGLRIRKRTDRGWLCSVRTEQARSETVFLHSWQVHSLLSQFDYIDRLEEMDVRLEDIQGFRAVDERLQGVKFGDYLQIEKYYQQYLRTQNPVMVQKMACYLYRAEGQETTLDELTKTETLATYLWVASAKMFLAQRFPYFFKKVDPEDAEEDDVDMAKGINLQIRALTDGDLTKRETILNTDCWDALFELNEKARESEEFRKKYGNK